MLTRKIERDNEEFVVALSEDKMSATVTDERGVVVTNSLQLRQLRRSVAETVGELDVFYG